jgi:hypothetical protein
VYTLGETLSEGGTYYLGAIPVVYFSTEADALANVSALAYYQIYVVQDVSGISSWSPAGNSTGTSTPGPFQDGYQLEGDGAYFLYPTISPGQNAISYYYSLTAAEAENPDGFLGIQPASSSIGTVSGDIGAYAYWKITPNSTGSSLSSTVYTLGNALNPSGKYYLGAIPVAYFANQADAAADVDRISAAIRGATGG